MKNFGTAALNDKRQTDRLVRVADALTRRPGGSLPEKLVGPGELDGLSHLMKASWRRTGGGRCKNSPHTRGLC